MKRIFILLSLVSYATFSQQPEEWARKPREQWPVIALVNEVLYKNGDSYEDPRLRQIGYAGTAFLVDTGQDTLAVTAKHLLWVARNRNKQTVSINEDLKHWVMHPKGNDDALVVTDKLLNEDDTEILLGGASTILDRDWLLFSIETASKKIHPLKPRYTALKPGEKVYRISNPYQSGATVVHESRVVRTEGWDILMEPDTTWQNAGASGSPVIDANGYLVGIMSSLFGDPKTGKTVEIATSTAYLRDFLRGKEDLNKPKLSVYEKLYTIVQNDGVDAAIRTFTKMTRNEKNYFIYNLRTSERELSRLGHKLAETGKFAEAVKIFELNLRWKPSWFAWNDLGKGYALSGEKQKAIQAYESSLAIYKNEEATKALEGMKKE